MKNRKRYPPNWEQIAHRAKEKADWTCVYCGLKGFKPGQRPSWMSRSEWTLRTLQVHHIDMVPENNNPENLSVCCVSCHLKIHQKRGSASPGQMSLF